MPGIPFFDNSTSYELAKFLSTFINSGVLIFSVLSAGIIFADWKEWKPKHIVTKIFKIIIHIIIFGTAILCILYSIDGRYSEKEVGESGKTNYYYFGGAKNQVRFGFGKLFDKNKNIYMICIARGNNSYDDVRKYKTENGVTYLSFEGTIKNGMKEGSGKEYSLIAGKRKLTYDGSFHKDLHTGEGTEFRYYSESGSISWLYFGEQLENKFNGHGKRWVYSSAGEVTNYYSGGWADDRYWGYGTEVLLTDGIVTKAYRGLFWDGEHFGKGIEEYYNSNDVAVIWVGYSNEGEHGENGAYYHREGEFWATESNGSKVQNDGGEWVIDEERKAELIEKWPFPDELLLGMDAAEVIQ